MNALITGGGGFIGSHLVDYFLTETDAHVTILDNFSTGSKENLSRFNTQQVSVREGDVRDTDLVDECVQDADLVFHLAAAVGVKKIVENPLNSLKTNLYGTGNVLEKAAKTGTKVFVASTSEVYGKSEAVPFAETDDRLLGPTTVPRWGYASAKATDEFLALSYYREHELPVVIGRYFNVVGPRQTGEYGMVIPRFVNQALADEPLTVYGDGTQTRSFMHVRDAVEISAKLLQTSSCYGDVYNIGAKNTVSINNLAERVIELTGSQSEIKHVPFEEVYGPDFEEPDRREPEVSKVVEATGLRADLDLDQIIKDVVEEQQGEVVES